ncbi:hypothetical protein ACKI1L_37950, partial [Streptomyces scabiei]|uniref:hypothetical protein n=1 Tax=Streptomyces scabiei TaxID=1930 RepID=UPI0038F7760A
RADATRQGKSELLLLWLRQRFSLVPEPVEAMIRAADHARLDRWSDRIFDARSLDEIFEPDPP